MMPKALLFDLDGTLLDSDPLHLAVFADMLAPLGIVVDEAYYGSNIHGRHNVQIFTDLMPGEDAQALDVAKEAAFRDLLAKTPMQPTPGLIALLDYADANGLPTAVATNACRLNAEAMLAALGIRDRFAAVLAAEECARTKPAPDVFLAAAKAVGVDARETLAFEDSPTGVAAANAAGCTVLGLPSTLTPAQLIAAGAHHVITDFTDPALARLLAAPTGATP